MEWRIGVHSNSGIEMIGGPVRVGVIRELKITDMVKEITENN